MPFIGYARLGEIVNKTEDQVREDKESGLIDLDDFESLVRYVADFWGMVDPSDLLEKIHYLNKEIEALRAQVANKKTAPKEEPFRQLDAKDLPGPTVRYKVVDTTKPSSDPYLDRTKARK